MEIFKILIYFGKKFIQNINFNKKENFVFKNLEILENFNLIIIFGYKNMRNIKNGNKLV